MNNSKKPKKIKDNKIKNKKSLNKKSSINENINKLARQNIENRKHYNKTKYGTYKKYENSNRTYEDNTSTNFKPKDDIFPQIIGVVILAAVIMAIIMAISGDANQIFSKKYFILVAFASVGMGIGVLLHNPEEEAKKKELKNKTKQREIEIKLKINKKMKANPQT